MLHEIHAVLFGCRMEWSDLRIFLAIARADTLGAAARSLGQTQPTMGRRLRALETAVGHVLFQRTADGFILTDEGIVLLEHVERMEEEALAFQRRPPAPMRSSKACCGSRLPTGSAPAC